MKWIHTHKLYIAWMISVAAVLGSLYYGEVLQFEPCRLCWYQRIAMFPLALFLGIAFYKDDWNLASYCIPLVGIGAFFSLYQSVSQFVPVLQVASLCGESSSCTTTGAAPYLSFLAFFSIGALIFKNRF